MNYPNELPQNPIVRLEYILGDIAQVTSAPTWSPRSFKDGWAFGNISGTRKLYVYDFTAKAWYFVNLTAVP